MYTSRPRRSSMVVSGVVLVTRSPTWTGMSPMTPSVGRKHAVVLQLHLLLIDLRVHRLDVGDGGIVIRLRLVEVLLADDPRSVQRLGSVPTAPWPTGASACLEARCESKLETVACCRRGSISIKVWPFFTKSPDFTRMAKIQPSTSDMMVAELRDLMVATYSEVSPTSWEATVCTFTGMAGGPCGPAAALLLPHAVKRRADAITHARRMPDTAAFARHRPGRTRQLK